MIIRLTDEASAELRSAYAMFPNLDKRQLELVEALLYHLASGNNVNIGMDSGYITIQKQGWKK